METEQELKGIKVLVVEDNFILAESMRWALEGLGAEVVGMAACCDTALELIQQAPVDVAILDLDLQGTSSAPVALELQGRGVPFVFLTGYENTTGLPEDLRDVRCLSKPMDPDDLAAWLVEELGRG